MSFSRLAAVFRGLRPRFRRKTPRPACETLSFSFRFPFRYMYGPFGKKERVRMCGNRLPALRFCGQSISQGGSIA